MRQCTEVMKHREKVKRLSLRFLHLYTCVVVKMLQVQIRTISAHINLSSTHNERIE